MLEVIVFICGAALMGIEFLAARMLAPSLGSSLFVWGSVTVRTTRQLIPGARPVTAMISIVEETPTEAWLNRCSLNRRPPTKMESPMRRRMLRVPIQETRKKPVAKVPRMEPRVEKA